MILQRVSVFLTFHSKLIFDSKKIEYIAFKKGEQKNQYLW